ncbi:hypothetical protein F66182_3446 [Fusarium sp. NRRL 66182]|nr:hypothetical protein F66182_3446 [Fusarium sp. NRRL 66182]
MFKQQANVKQIGSHSYTSSHHRDWTIGPTLHGGSVAAILYLVAETHFQTTLEKYRQPDVLTLHVEFLRYCTPKDSTIIVTDLKRGATTCNIQLRLVQDDQTKVMAFASSTNFSQSLGPGAQTDWAFHPPPKPAPSFAKVLAREPDENWIPVFLHGQIFPLPRHWTYLIPRGGFPVAGVYEAWSTLNHGRMDAATMALMVDMIPSLSDTLLGNDGLWDAHKISRTAEAFAEEHPGQVCNLTNSAAEAARASVINNTVCLEVEFKKRVPREGIQWVFTRAEAKQLAGGRMDLDVTLCDEDMDLVCHTRQVILVLDAQKRFRDNKL